MTGEPPTSERGSEPAQSLYIFRLTDYVNISIYSFGLRGFTFALTAIIVPVLLLDIVPEDRKNTYLGLASFTALMLAIVAQPAAGALSDRVRLWFGRRHPYILVGTVIACLLVPGLALTDSFIQFLLIFAAMTVAIQIAQGPFQAFIPDLVPTEKHGLAAAYKTGAEITGIAVVGGLVGYVAGQYSGAGQFGWVWASLGLLAGIYLASMALTVSRVQEDRRPPLPAKFSRPPLAGSVDGYDRFFPPGFPWYLASRFLFLGATGIIETFGLFYLRDVVEVSSPAQGAGVLSVVIGVAALFGALGAGRISEKVGYRSMVAGSGGAGAFGAMLLLWAGSLEQVLAAGVIMGVALGLFFSADWALATFMVSPRKAAQQMGLTNIATAGGAAASRLLGFGVDALNSGSAVRGYEGLILICAIAFLLGGLLVFAVRPASIATHVPE